MFINDMKERYPVEEHLHSCDGDVDPTTPDRGGPDEGDDSDSDSDSDADSESADDDGKAPSRMGSTHKNKAASSTSQERKVLPPKPNKPPPTTPPERAEEQSETPKRGKKRKKSPEKIVPDLSKNSNKKPTNSKAPLPASPVEKGSPTSTEDDDDSPVYVSLGSGAMPLCSAQRIGQPAPIEVAHTPPNETSSSVVPTLFNFQIERMTDLVLGCTHAPSAALYLPLSIPVVQATAPSGGQPAAASDSEDLDIDGDFQAVAYPEKSLTVTCAEFIQKKVPLR